MAFGSKEYNKVFEDFKKGQKWLNDIEVEIVGGEADVDPLVLLRIYDDKVTIDNELTLASAFCMNRVIRFFNAGNMVYEVAYKGGNLGDCFPGRPYLLDVLLKMSYGLMIKKLTPPSEDSEKEERQ